MASDPAEAMDRFERKLDAVESQIGQLRVELATLRDIVVEPSEEPSEGTMRSEEPPEVASVEEVEAALPPTEKPVVPAEFAAQREQAEASYAVPAAAAVPTGEPEPAPVGGPAAGPAAVDWESLVGANWLNRIGVLVLILAGGFLVHLAWQRQWIGPAAQVVAVFVCGAALLAGGEVFQRRKLPVFGQGLTALGIVALYAGGLVGYHLHHLFSLNATFGVYVAITAASFILAVRSNSIAVVLLGMLGGYLTPIILSTGKDQPVALFTYLLSLNAAISATAIARRWGFLNPIAFVSTALMFVSWYGSFYEPHKVWILETMLSLHAGLFLAAAVFPRLLLGQVTADINLWMVTKTSLLFFGVTYLLFHTRPEHRLGEFAALYGAGHWLLAAGVYALRGRGDRLTAYLLGLGAVFVTIAVPIYFSGDTRAVAWATQALVFTIIGLRYRSERTLAAATLVFVLATWWTCGHDIFSDVARGEWGPLDARFATTGVVAAMIAGAALAYRLGRERTAGMDFLDPGPLSFLFAVVADLLLVGAAVHQFNESGLALVWAANAFVVCVLAGWRRHPGAGTFGAMLFLPAFIRFIQWHMTMASPQEWALGLDVRFVEGLLIVAASWCGAVLIRGDRRWEDLPHKPVLLLLGGDAFLLLASTLQWHGAWLTGLWAVNALAIAAFARWQGLQRMAVVSVWAFACVTITWLGANVGRGRTLEAMPSVMESLPSGLALVGAGWLAAWLLRPRPQHLATVLALGMNLVLLGVIAHQWDGYATLTLWAVEISAIWAVGFVFRWAAVRFQAMLLWVGLFGLWIMMYGMPWLKPLQDFTLLINPRFGAFALVGLTGLGAAVAYRRLVHWLPPVGGIEPADPAEPQTTSDERRAGTLAGWLREERERWHLVCVVLANLVLVGALTAEVSTLFNGYAWSGGGPFDDLVMARQATMSILWASYAAVLFIVGFVIRYAPIRIMAMVGLAPILLKVFLVDLRNLEVAYRVLSFAVLGAVFVGVSYLYQRYRSRLGLDSPNWGVGHRT